MQRALGQKREPSRGEEVLPKVSCGHFEVCLVVLRVRLIEDHRKREGIIRDPPPYITGYSLVALPVQSFVRYSSGVQVKTGSNCNET